MRVKQYKGKVYGAELTAKEQKAMDIEINRQILEADKRYTNDIDAMVLYALHKHLGFGPKRLRRFWEAFNAEHKKLRDYYEMPDGMTVCAGDTDCLEEWAEHYARKAVDDDE